MRFYKIILEYNVILYMCKIKNLVKKIKYEKYLMEMYCLLLYFEIRYNLNYYKIHL